jgi:hypothetical protein
MKKIMLWILLLFNQVLASGQILRHQLPANVTLQFVPVVGQKPLFIDSSYNNSFGEQYTVTKFRYYISQLNFTGSLPGTQAMLFDTCFLIDERVPESKIITLHVPDGHYDHISFLLGVDSIKNVSGAQSGSLDPLLDMFWTWNTGYVMAKLEGSSPVSKLPHHMIEYHIGGFSGRFKVLRNINLTTPDNGVILIEKTGKKKIVIEANVNAWFNGVHELTIAGNPSCTSIGELAQKFSDNYSKMFTIRSIINE